MSLAEYLARLKPQKLPRDETSLLVSNLGCGHYYVLLTVKFHFIENLLPNSIKTIIIWCFQAPHSWGQPYNLIIFFALIIGYRSTSLKFKGWNPCDQRFYTSIACFVSCFKKYIHMMITFISKKKLRGYVLLSVFSFIMYYSTHKYVDAQRGENNSEKTL